MSIILLFLLTGFLSGWIFTIISIRISHRYRIHDLPGRRSSHSVATPRLGGLGIAAPFFLFSLLYFTPVSRAPGLFPRGLMAPLLLGGAGCFLFGLWDDLRGMKAGNKLIFQMLCALVPVILGLRILSLARFTGFTPPPALGYVLGFFWILLMINAFNFMDGMNGLAGTFAAVAFLFIFARAGIGGEPFLLLCVFLAASCMGFLIYNLTPALTFMGDSGSQFLGFVLAVIPLYLHKNDPETFPFGAFVILLFPFLYDVLFTLTRRLKRGENLFEAHRTHLYQRLMIAGWSQRKILKLLFIIFILCGFLSLGFAGTKQTVIRGLYAFGALILMTLYSLLVLVREKKHSKINAIGGDDDSLRKIR